MNIPPRHVCSLVAGFDTSAAAAASGLPLCRVVRAVPLPAVARRGGVTLVLGTGGQRLAVAPETECTNASTNTARGAVAEVLALFDTLGKAVEAGSEEEMAALQTLTATMGP